MGLRSTLARLIGPPAPQPDVQVNITITPECVIRPGDTVVLCLPGQPVWAGPGIRKAAENNWLPAGAKLALFCGDGIAANVSQLVGELLRSHRGGRGDNGNPEPSLGGKGPDGAQQDVQQPAPAVDDVPVLVAGVGRSPEAIEQSASQSHAQVSP